MPKPDESRLLTDKEKAKLYNKLLNETAGDYPNEMVEVFIKAQDAKTDSIKDAEIKRLKEDHEKELQKRVERIFREIEKRALLRREVNAVDGKIHPVRQMNILEKEWQALKKLEGIVE